METTITISRKDYDELMEDQQLLNCLRNGGLDNWEGWDDAIAMFETYNFKGECSK